MAFLIAAAGAACLAYVVFLISGVGVSILAFIGIMLIMIAIFQWFAATTRNMQYFSNRAHADAEYIERAIERLKGNQV